MNIFIPISDYHKNTKCSVCGSKETYIRIKKGKGYPLWASYNGGKICGKCHNKLVVNVKYKHLKIKTRRINFEGIDIDLTFDLPRDKCEICGITKKERKIDRHHYFYLVIMKWACTIPICGKCHAIITHKGKKYKKKTKK